MAIRILYGPGGSGKSNYQMRIVERELRFTRRNVVTNLAIDLPALQEYMERNYPTEKIDVTKRIRVLTVEEAREFWKYRGIKKLDAGDLWEGSPYDDTLTTVSLEDDGRYGVCFILDEAGALGFNARGWAAIEGKSTRGAQCEWYLDQQRKFTDDVWASCNGRHPTAIAKPFRDKAHEFVRLSNGYLQTWGKFKGKGEFKARFYTHEPDKTSEPFKEEKWKLDASGLSGCYRTQDGVGVTGLNADIGQRAKGIPIQFMIPGIIIGLMFLLVGVPKMLSKAVKNQKPVHADRVTAKPNEAHGVKPLEKASVDKSAQNVAPNSQHVSSPDTTSSVEPVRIAGIVESSRGVNVVLTNGRTLQEGQFRRFRTYVEEQDGTRYYFKRPVERVVERPQPAKIDTADGLDAQRKAIIERWESGRGETAFEPSPSLRVMGAGGMPQNGSNATGSPVQRGLAARRP